MATSSLSVANWFETTASASISSTDTTINLNNTAGLPTEGYLVIEPDNSSNREIIYYTSKTASSVVLPSLAAGRGVDNTSAVAHASGSTVRMNIVAQYWKDLQSGAALNAGALGGTPFATGWINSVLPAVSSVTNNGQRSYDVTFASTVASYLTPGMRLRLSRTVAAPTQCTSLNGTTQYYSKTSPSGMTFTDDFTVSAWVKLNSYGAVSQIASRYNGTSGWQFRCAASGQVELIGINGGASNISKVTSYQSIPLNKWVHVTAQLDMSTFTATTTTSYIMIDGIDVPATASRAGTNPTALVQAGNLEIGTANAAEFFPGKIAQVAIFSAKVTQATIRTYMSQGLAGTETNLISAYSFNNSINDLNTTNANNLTANGSAVATNADSPFTVDANGTPGGTYEYAIVTKVATTTATVQVPEGNAIPTSGGVSAVELSSWKAPYAFPSQASRWDVETINRADSSSTANSTYNHNITLTVPIGEWNLGYEWRIFLTNSTGAPNAQYGLSTSSSAFSHKEFMGKMEISIANSSVSGMAIRNNPVSLSAVTTYYTVTVSGNAGTSQNIRDSTDGTSSYVRARNAYL